MPTEEQRMKILKNYFTTQGFVKHQISSYNHMIQHSLQMIIGEESLITVEPKPGVLYRVEFGQVHVDRPYVIEEDRTVRYIQPAEARLRDDTYDAPLSIDIRTILTIAGVVKETKQIDKYIIGHIPVMLKSSKCNLNGLDKKTCVKVGECPEDPGGYFIIRGKERALVSQERAAYNFIGVYKQKSQSKYSHVAEVRSMSDTTGHSVLIQCKISKTQREICFSLPYIQQEIPVGIVFIAMGFSIEDIESLVNLNPKCQKYLRIILGETTVSDQEEALQHVGKYAMHVIAQDKRVAYASQILENEIFPHMGVITHSLERGMFLGMLVKKLVETHSGIRPQDDRDNIANKRLEVAGVLISGLFRSLFKRLVRSVTPVVQKRPDIEIALSRFNTVTQGFRSCFSTGKWGVQKNSYVRQGVSQVLSRLTFGATLSHLRRIVIPIGKEGKNTQIRQLHGSQIFYVCLFETPEGHSSGIVKNFALTCEVTNGTDSTLVRDIMENLNELLKISELENISDHIGDTRVCLDGNLIGLTKSSGKLCEILRKLRDENQLNYEVSVAYDDIDNEIHVATDSGRMIRPLFSVKNLKNNPLDTNLEWFDLVNKGIVQYRDPAELENMVVAMSQKNLDNYNENIQVDSSSSSQDSVSENSSDLYSSSNSDEEDEDEFSSDSDSVTKSEELHKYDFCEIHPSMMMGVCASIIPFPDHSQSPRNCYQSAMGKQALGIYALSNAVRADTIVHMLDNAQMPLTTTKIASFMGFDNLPSGQNVIVAILTYTGFNQEDSVLMNLSAIQRGLFRVTTYKTVVHVEKKKGTNYHEKIMTPETDLRKRFCRYDKLGDDGIIIVGSKVKKGDVLIGRVLTHTSKNGTSEMKDCSIAAKGNEKGVVDTVVVGTTPEGFKFVKIKIRSIRIPEVGDKFASRSAQKGTIGAVYSQEDMPFTLDGIVPDVIINPHCIPSRMTINQLLESLGSMLSTVTGRRRDATAFSKNSTNIVETIRSELQSFGFNKNGDTRMCNGFTGEMMDASIFMGPTYYQRLRHMVSDKMHARAHGECQVLTRQPLEGRARDGGLRFGEMERDCMISHGSSAFLKERLLEMSDYFEVDVCDNCHQISRSDVCRLCGKDAITRIQFPYACKLLFHELQAMCLKIDLLTD